MDANKEIKYVGYFLTILFIVVFLGFIILNFTIFRYPTQLVSGKSMEPTIHDPETVKYDHEKIPIENDIIIFDCLIDKCSIKSNLNPDKNLIGMLVKRIIKINENGEYWVEGDNKEHSWDSRKYGWLSPSDIHIVGVVIR